MRRRVNDAYAHEIIFAISRLGTLAGAVFAGWAGRTWSAER